MLKNKSLRTRRFIAKYVSYVEVFGYLFVATLAAGIFVAWFYEVDDGVQHDKDPIIQPMETVLKDSKESYVHRLFVTEPFQRVRKGDPIVEVVDRPKWVDRYRAVIHLRAALDEWNTLEAKLAKEAEKKAKAAEKAAGSKAPGAQPAKPGKGETVEAGSPKRKPKKQEMAAKPGEDESAQQVPGKKKHKPKRPAGAEAQQSADVEQARQRPEGEKAPKHEKGKPAREHPGPRLAQQPVEKKPAPAALAEKPAATAPVEKPTPAAPGERPAGAPPVEKPAPATPGEKPVVGTPGEKAAPPAPGEKPAAPTPGQKPAPGEKPAAPASGEKPTPPAPGEKLPATAPGEKPAPTASGDRTAQAPAAEKPAPEVSPKKKAKPRHGGKLAQAPATEGAESLHPGSKPVKSRDAREPAEVRAGEAPSGADEGQGPARPKGKKKGKKHPHDQGAEAGAAPEPGAEGALAEAPPPSPLPKPDAKLKEAVEAALAQWDEKAGDRAPKKVLFAPHDGIVVIKPTIENQIVAKNKEIAKVADFSVLQIVLKLKGENLPHVRVGQSAKIAVRAEQPPNRLFWGDREGLLWRAERVQFSDLIDTPTKDWLRDELKKKQITRDDGDDIALDVTDVDAIKINAKLKTTPVAPRQIPGAADRLRPDMPHWLELRGHVQKAKHTGKFMVNELPPDVEKALEQKLLAKFQGKVIEDTQPFRIDGFRSLAVMTTVKAETELPPKNEDERKLANQKARSASITKAADRLVDATVALDNPPEELVEAVEAQYKKDKPTGPRVDVDVVTDRKRFAMLLFRQ